jgi:transposase
VVEGIMFRYRTGVAWRDLPGRFGPWQTVWKQHHRYATDYCGRNVIERAFNGFKHWRGLATRYDKHAIVYRGGLVLAAVLLWLTDLGDAPS